MKNLVALINSFNRCDLLEGCLTTLTQELTSLGIPTAVVVYDAGSNDGSREYIRDFSTNSPVPLHLYEATPDEDTSFSAGLNRASEVARMHPNGISFAGEHGLRQTFSVVNAADFVIGNSSMLMHVAAAFQKRSLILLGPMYQSAEKHRKQWGYEEECHLMGPELEIGSGITDVGEAWSRLQELLS